MAPIEADVGWGLLVGLEMGVHPPLFLPPERPCPFRADEATGAVLEGPGDVLQAGHVMPLAVRGNGVALLRRSEGPAIAGRPCVKTVRPDTRTRLALVDGVTVVDVRPETFPSAVVAGGIGSPPMRP